MFGFSSLSGQGPSSMQSLQWAIKGDFGPAKRSQTEKFPLKDGRTGWNRCYLSFWYLMYFCVGNEWKFWHEFCKWSWGVVASRFKENGNAIPNTMIESGWKKGMEMLSRLIPRFLVSMGRIALFFFILFFLYGPQSFICEAASADQIPVKKIPRKYIPKTRRYYQAPAFGKRAKKNRRLVIETRRGKRQLHRTGSAYNIDFR